MQTYKVLHIGSNGGVGGREKILFTLMHHHTTDPTLRIALYLKKPEGPFYDLIKNMEIEIFSGSSGGFFKNLFFHIALFEKFELLVFHFFDWRLFLAAWLSHTRKIYVLSGIYLQVQKNLVDVLKIVFSRMWPDTLDRSVDTYGMKKNGATPVVLPSRNSLRRLLKRWGFILSLRSALFPVIIVNSNYALHRAVQSYSLRRGKLKVIYNGVETPSVTMPNDQLRQEFHIRREDFVIGTVCRFDKRKRIDRLLKCFSRIREKSVYKLLIVGGGDDRIENQIREFTKANGLDSEVILTGTRMDIGNLINMMNLFVLPSDNESFGLALVEAMLLEKPALVFKDSGGPAEIMCHRFPGFVIEGTDDFISLCTTLYQNPQYGKKMGKEARQYALSSFSTQRFLDEFHKLYSLYLN